MKKEIHGCTFIKKLRKALGDGTAGSGKLYILKYILQLELRGFANRFNMSYVSFFLNLLSLRYYLTSNWR